MSNYFVIRNFLFLKKIKGILTICDLIKRQYGLFVVFFVVHLPFFYIKETKIGACATKLDIDHLDIKRKPELEFVNQNSNTRIKKMKYTRQPSTEIGKFNLFNERN